MSTEPKIDLAGWNIKEWSLIILLFILGIAVTVFVVGFAHAMMNNADALVVEGKFDMGQYSGIIIGIAIVAVTLVGQQLAARNQANAIRQTDEAWLKSELQVLPPDTPGKKTAFNMPELYKKTLLLSSYVKKIYESDSILTAKEQQEAIQAYEGISAAEMEALIPKTGPELAESIRKIISKHRATNRTDKDRSD